MESDNNLLSIAIILLAICCLFTSINVRILRHRIDKIESSYVTQEQIDTTLIEIYD